MFFFSLILARPFLLFSTITIHKYSPNTHSAVALIGIDICTVVRKEEEVEDSVSTPTKTVDFDLGRGSGEWPQISKPYFTIFYTKERWGQNFESSKSLLTIHSK